MTNVLVTELMWHDGIELLEHLGYHVDYDPNLSRKRAELLKLIPDYQVIIVRNETKVNDEFLKHAKKLKVLGRLGVGVDNIDLQKARFRNVPVVVARNANATSVAEYVMAAMLDACRNIHLADRDVRKTNWNRKIFTGKELHGRTLGLIGLGEIAHRVAKRAKVFGMHVIGYDPFVSSYDHIIQETNVKQVSRLEELLNSSDFISIHTPLTKGTKHLLNESTLQRVKKGAYIINTARGGIINENDLTDAVQSGQLAGAYLDVLEKEPVDPNCSLLNEKNIILTPHIAGLTEEAQSRTARLIAQEVHNVYKGGSSLCIVN